MIGDEVGVAQVQDARIVDQGLVIVLAMLARVILRCFFASACRSTGPTMPSAMSAIIMVRDAAT